MKIKHKILVFTSTFPRWPNDTDPPFVYELSKRLTSDFEVSVLTPHYPGASTKEYMEGMTIYRFRYFVPPFEKLAGSIGIIPTLKKKPFYYLIVPFFLIIQLLSLISLSRKIRPDTIHAHWVVPQGVIAFIAEKLTGVPFVVTAHGADIFALRGIFFLWLKRKVLKGAKAITVVSESLLKAIPYDIEKVFQVKVIPMGVSKMHFSPDQKDLSIKEKYDISGPFLLYAGRLSEKKGVYYLVEAMTRVLADFPTAKLLILGNGELASDLRQQVSNLKLDANILFLGAVTNKEMPQYYSTANVFIGPSIQTTAGDTEGFGLTFVEAAMSGCFAIGTNVGGIGDIIRDKETGFMVPQKNSMALAKAIIYSLKNKSETIVMSDKARRYCIKKFEWQVIANRYTKILQQVCTNKFDN